MLASLSVENFRCISSAEISFDERATGVIGSNAAGKTSLLEAVFFLAHGRSFRTANRSELIERSSARLRVVGSAQMGASHNFVGIEFDGRESITRMGGQPVGSAQVARTIPVQIIDPSVHRLLEEGSLRRRRLLDWGVFHVEPQFVVAWRRYQRALLQRNTLLQNCAPDAAIRVWSDALIEASNLVHSARCAYAADLAATFESLGSELLGLSVTLNYKRGWPADQEFGVALSNSRPRELSQRTTVVGPHRADLEIQVDGTLARKRVSRGQQKLLASILILAQIDIRARRETVPTCLLLDDPSAELDVDNLGKLLKIVQRIPAQLIVSSLERERLHGLAINRMFHVEQGRFRQVV